MMNRCSFIVDNDLTVKSWDSNMEKLSYKPAGDVVGHNINKIFPMLSDKIAPVFSNGRKRRVINFQNNCLKGNDISAEIHLIPVKDRRGNVKEVSVVFDNISSKCPVEKKLIDSEKMVAIGKMASSLAHGVRNPLNAIKGAVVYLREKYGHESTLLEFSTIINEEIDKLDSFVSSFLSTARGEIKFAPVNINVLITSILAMIKPRSEIQGIKILHSLSDLPVIAADSFQLEQALFNIINNALEAMPDGGVINLKTFLKWESETNYIIIEISDTGQGIPDKELKRLGELTDDSKRDDRGFGIFLSREVIKSHNGRLLWESMRDRGTTFKIMLPVKHGER